jgi:hypothetical protein
LCGRERIYIFPFVHMIMPVLIIIFSFMENMFKCSFMFPLWIWSDLVFPTTEWKNLISVAFVLFHWLIHT